MRRTIRAISLVMLLCAVASLEVDAQNQTDSKGRKQGKWSKTYAGGQIQYEGTFKDDCETGTFRYYNKDGSLKQTIDYKSDCKSGYSKVYYRKGQVMSEGMYVDKKKEGLWTYYSEDGKTLSQENYSKGKKEGKETIWDTEGNVLETIMYHNGKRNGQTYNFLYQDGYQTFTYQDDQKEGEYKNFYADSKVKICGQFKKDKKDGLWIFTDAYGGKIRVQKWKQGELLSDKLVLRDKKGERTIESKDIAYMYPLGKQTCIVMSNGEKFNCFNYFEQILDCTDLETFVRLNKTNNIYANPKAIKRVVSPNAEQSEVILSPDSGITVIADSEAMKALRSILNTSSELK